MSGTRSHPSLRRILGLDHSRQSLRRSPRAAILADAVTHVSRRCVVESLEPRQLLAAGPIISEFMASNDANLPDEDGDYSDWIELHNPTTADITLQGYHLTNNDNDLERWEFPATPLPAGAYMVVFASEKDRAVAGKELHTNFNLDAAEGYLALVKPDGEEVAYEYAPEYPRQVTDMSYGVAVDVQRTPLIRPDASVKVFIPSNDALGLNWTTAAYSDLAWTGSFTGVGFEPPGGLPAEVEPNDTTATANSALQNFRPHAGNLYHLGMKGSFGSSEDWFKIGTLQIGDIVSITDSGTASARGTLDNPILELWRGDPNSPVMVASDNDSGPGLDALIHHFQVTGTDSYYVRAVNPGGIAGQQPYQIGVWLEDNGTAPTTGGNFSTEQEGNNNAAQANDASTSWRPVQFQSSTTGAISTAADKDIFRYQFAVGDMVTIQVKSLAGADARVSLLNSAGSIVAQEDGTSSAPSLPAGDSMIYSFVIPAAGTYYVQVQSSNSTTGPYAADVYLSTNTAPPVTNPYAAFIRTNVSADMSGKTSAYIRVPFIVDDPLEFDTLQLRMKYDDGFVVYLNGQRVASRSAPADPLRWNSAASDTHPNAQALIDEYLNIPTTHLRAGQNVLAIHGLNAAADMADFLIYPELDGVVTLSNVLRYFADPTPRGENGASDVLGVVADTKFSHNRGFYDAPFSVTITTATEGAQIRYTLDGSEPKATTGTIYTAPIPITTTTVLRAAAFKPGFVSTSSDTQTYLFLNDVIHQPIAPAGFPTSGIHWDYEMDPDVVNNPAYTDTIIDDLMSIPSMSIVGNVNDIFGPSGIYANPEATGIAWERPASAELIYPDGKDGFQINAGLRIYGGVNRSTGFAKHTFRLLFKDQYGPGKLNYPLFQDALFGDTAVDEFDTIILRGEFNNTWPFWVDAERNRAQYIQDRFIADTQLAMGQPAPHGMFVHLYVNGLYWGLYSPTERPSAPFAASYLGGEEEQYDALNSSEAIDGDKTAWSTLQSLASAGVTTPAQYDQIKQYLDVDNFIDYMILNFYGGNQDWDDHNWYAARKREAGAGFKFFSWDAERTLEDVNANQTGVGQADKPSFIYSRLRNYPEFRMRFADRVYEHFFNDGALTPANAAARYQALADMVDRAVVGESARWGDRQRATPYTRDVEWVRQRDWELNTYFPVRTNNVLNQFKSISLYPSVNPPSFNQHGGSIPPGFKLKMTVASGTLYYTLDGSDPRLEGGAVSPTALTYTTEVPLGRTTAVNARVRLANGTWSALHAATFYYNMSSLRVTEMMYHPPDPPSGSPYTTDDFEFIELQNTGNAPLDLTGVRFTDGIAFVFPSMILQPQQRTVVVKNVEAFKSRYGTSIPIAGFYANTLADGGERIVLSGPASEPILDFEYQDGWYPTTDGGGYSMVVVNPKASAASFSLETNWRPSDVVNGGPSMADPGVNPGTVVINEALTHSDGPLGDWIELRNTAASPLDISGWFLSDDLSDLRKYQIPAGTVIPPRAYVVFNQTQHFGNPDAPGANVPFGITEYGERLWLCNSDGAGNVGGYRESVDFPAAEKEVTFGRFIYASDEADFISLRTPTMGAVNDVPLAGSVVINELMYNPTAGGDEFVELKNLTASPVPLHDNADPINTWQLTSGITYSFPADAQIPAFGYALAVLIDPAIFRAKYAIPDTVPVYGPYEGSLSNGGEDVKLLRPGVPDPGGVVPYLFVDKVKYADQVPWPTEPDGSGPSLQKISPAGYGSDAGNWEAGPSGGTPGAPNGHQSPVVDLGPDLVINIGQSFACTGAFDDPGSGQTWNALATWGDTTPPQMITLMPDKTFTLNHAYASPGTYTITATITDNAGSVGTDRLILSVVPLSIQGASSPDSFTLRLDPSGMSVHFFNNAPLTGKPTYQLRQSTLLAITILGGGGDDTATVDLSSYNPIPPGGLHFDGNTGADVLRLVGTTRTDTLSVNGSQLMLGPTTITWTNATAEIHPATGTLIELGSLSFAAGTLSLPSSGGAVLRVGLLDPGVSGVLDLQDNGLIVPATADARDAVLAQVCQWIRSARGNSAAWTGPGLTSTKARDNPATTLAAVINDKGPAAGPILTKFNGADVTDDDILVKYTWNGDATLDGVVNADDYFLIDAGFIMRRTGFRNGDFNYDGVINADDYFLIDSAFLQQTGLLCAETSPPASPPEHIANSPAAAPLPESLIRPGDESAFAHADAHTPARPDDPWQTDDDRRRPNPPGRRLAPGAHRARPAHASAQSQRAFSPHPALRP